MFVNKLLLLVTCSLVKVPLLAISISSVSILYACFVPAILFSIYVFSLSSSFGFTTINWNTVIIINKHTKYAGITQNAVIALRLWAFFMYLIPKYTAIGSIQAKILYPHTFIVTSVRPPPYSRMSDPMLIDFSNITLFALKNVISASANTITITLNIICFIATLFFSVSIFIPSKYMLKTAI